MMAITSVSLGQVSHFNTFCLPQSRYRAQQASLFGDLFIVLFLCAQVLDGAFTYMGVHVFGPGIEANPLIAWLMGQLGPALALVSAKSAAIVFGSFLHLLNVHIAVAMLTLVYLALAIGPWTHLLYFF